MNKICPYVNEHQYKTETKSKDIRLRFKAIIALAEAGNAEAMYLYGYALLTGIWDLEGMKNDMAHGKLLPPTEDAKDDPYLVIPRDIAKAVEYLRLIADMPGYDGEFWKKQAQGILTYCQKNGLAGFFVGDIKVSYPNPAEYLSSYRFHPLCLNNFRFGEQPLQRNRMGKFRYFLDLCSRHINDSLELVR